MGTFAPYLRRDEVSKNEQKEECEIFYKNVGQNLAHPTRLGKIPSQ